MHESVWGPTHNGRPKHAPLAYAARVRPGFTRTDLAKLFAASGFTKGAEIGVADGRYSLVLCQSIPNVELTCVDPWKAYPDNPRGGPQSQHDGNYALAHTRLDPYGADLMRMTSREAVTFFEDGELDFVYIDGHHGFDYVMLDLILWNRTVRKGGIIAGHDFYNFRWAGVVEAVDAYTRAHGITDWQLCDEREPSFWWVKT